jgi:hypothetical protein
MIPEKVIEEFDMPLLLFEPVKGCPELFSITIARACLIIVVGIGGMVDESSKKKSVRGSIRVSKLSWVLLGLFIVLTGLLVFRDNTEVHKEQERETKQNWPEKPVPDTDTQLQNKLETERNLKMSLELQKATTVSEFLESILISVNP